MKRSRGDRRDLSLRKRRKRYNQLRGTLRSRWITDSELWRRAKTDKPFAKWAEDPENRMVYGRLRNGGLPAEFYDLWMYREGARFGVWTEKERRDFQEAMEV